VRGSCAASRARRPVRARVRSRQRAHPCSPHERG
jgi:hypothetical protein